MWTSFVLLVGIELWRSASVCVQVCGMVFVHYSFWRLHCTPVCTTSSVTVRMETCFGATERARSWRPGGTQVYHMWRAVWRSMRSWCCTVPNGCGLSESWSGESSVCVMNVTFVPSCWTSLPWGCACLEFDLEWFGYACSGSRFSSLEVWQRSHCR
jgi:hypothetical protein